MNAATPQPETMLERPQEVDDVLLILAGQPMKALDHPVGFASGALMVLDSLHQIAGAAVVKKEDPLSDTPERGGSELVGSCATLCNSVRETSSHVMDEEVGPEVGRLVGEGCARDFR